MSTKMSDKSVNMLTPIIAAFIRSCNVSDMNKVQSAHLESWKQYLNGNKNSQLQSDTDMEKAIREVLSSMDAAADTHITNELYKSALNLRRFE